MRDEARQPRLGGEQVVEAGVEPVIGDVVADGEQVALAVVEEPEVDVRELAAADGQRRARRRRRRRARGEPHRRRAAAAARRAHRPVAAASARSIAGARRCAARAVPASVEHRGELGDAARGDRGVIAGAARQRRPTARSGRAPPSAARQRAAIASRRARQLGLRLAARRGRARRARPSARASASSRSSTRVRAGACRRSRAQLGARSPGDLRRASGTGEREHVRACRRSPAKVSARTIGRCGQLREPGGEDQQVTGEVAAVDRRDVARPQRLERARVVPVVEVAAVALAAAPSSRASARVRSTSSAGRE